MRKLKIICQGEMCKIDKSPSLLIKMLKNMIPVKDGKWNIFFFKFEILATNIEWSQNFEKHLSAIAVTKQRP